MATASDLIQDAYREIGVIGQGKTMSAYLGQAGLRKLNQMLGDWSTQPNMVVERVGEDLSIAASASSYTIGSGGDFNTTRPEEILDAYIRVGGTDYPLEVFSMQEYNDIPTKSQGAIPENIWYEPAYPMGTIYFDWKPSVGNTLHINSLKPLTSLSTLATSVSLPAGYELAIVNNLAILLAPANGKTPSQLTFKAAQDGIDHIKAVRARQRVPVSSMPAGLVSKRRYNILSDS
jgi:hypothetical protein